MSADAGNVSVSRRDVPGSDRTRRKGTSGFFLFFFLVLLLFLLLAESAAQNLAYEGLGQFVPEFEDAGNLVRSQLGAAERGQFGNSDLFAFLGNDVGLECFASGLVRDAEGDGFLDLGIFVQHLVDFAGKDVVAADDGHVLLTVDDKIVAVAVAIGDVAGVEPAVRERGGGFLRLIPVAFHDLRTANDEFAALVVAEFGLAGFDVDDACFGFRDGHADGAYFLKPVHGIGDDHRRGFGKAETFGDVGVRDVLELLEAGLGEGRGTGNAELDAGKVVMSDVLLLHEGDVDGRSADEEGGSVFFDQFQHIVRGIARHGHGGCGQNGGKHDVAHESEDVEEGHDAEEAVGGIGGVAMDDGKKLLYLCGEVAVGEHCSFGESGGAARVLEKGQRLFGVFRFLTVAAAGFEHGFPRDDTFIIEGDFRRMSLTFGLKGLKQIQRKGEGVGDAGDDAGLNAETGTERFDFIPEQVEGDEKFRRGVAEMMGQLLFHIEGVGHDYRGACLERAPEGNDGLRQVRQHDGHSVSGVQPVFAQGGGEGFGLVLELPVRERKILEDDGLVVAETGSSLIQIGLDGTGNKIKVDRRTLGDMGQPGRSGIVHEAYPGLEEH